MSNPEITAADAMKALKAAFKSDPAYAWSWHCAIWAGAHDEGMETGAANRAAARVMHMAFDVDTSKHANFNPEHRATPAPAIAAAPESKSRVLYADEPIDDQSFTPLATQAPVADQPAEPSPAGLSDELRSFIEGMSVSVDVSTGDDDAGHRYFGTVTEVMDDLHDKHHVTLLVQDAAPNFKAAGFTLVHRATGKEHRTIPPGGHLVLDSWEERECDVRLAAPKGDSNG